MNLIRSLFLSIVMLCTIGEPAFANPAPLTTTLTAPSPGQTFSNMPSGATYKADNSGNVSGVLASDVPAMLKAGCTAQSGGGSGGATIPFPGIVYGTSATGGTVATSNQIQSAIGSGVYDASGAASAAQAASDAAGAAATVKAYFTAISGILSCNGMGCVAANSSALQAAIGSGVYDASGAASAAQAAPNLAGATGINSVATGGTGATTAQSALQSLEGQPMFYVANYGAKSNGLTLADVTTTASSATVTSTAHTFTSADVGKYFVIPNAGGTNVSTSGTINSISGNSATLSSSSSVSLTNATMYFGTDDTTAIQAAVTAAANIPGGAVVVLPTGMSMIGAGGAGLAWQSHVSMVGAGMTQSALVWDYFGNGGHGMIYGFSQSSANPYSDMHFSDFEANAVAMTAYSTTAKIFYMKYLLRPVFQRLYLHDSPATALGTDFLVDATITDNVIANGGRLNNGTQAGGAGIGVGTDNETSFGHPQGSIVANNHVYMAQGSRFGIFYEQQGASQPVIQIAIRVIGNFIYSSNGIGIQDAGNAGMVIEGNTVIGGGASCTGCLDGISVGSGSTGTTVGTQDTIVGNNVQGMANGIGLNYSVNGYGTSTPVNSVVADNHVYGNVGAGIAITGNATLPLIGLKVSGNYSYLNGGAGITISGAGGLTDVTFSDNQLMNNGATSGTATQKAGISVNSPVTRLKLIGNVATDNLTGTQSYGFVLAASSAVTGGLMQSNSFGNNGIAALNLLSTFAGQVQNNSGFPTFTLSGGCASNTPVGQGDVGTFKSGTGGSCVTTILPYGTANIIAPNGWACSASDLTTPTDLIGQTASSTTGCTLTGTTVSADLIAFQARQF